MYTSEDMLRQYAISVLRSNYCKQFSFTVAGTTITGYVYSYVADLIANGSIGVRIRSLPNALNARYSNPPGGSPQLEFNSNFSKMDAFGTTRPRSSTKPPMRVSTS